MELLDIFDDNMNLIGQADRAIAHAQGLIHQVVHVWIVSELRGEPALIFQQRSWDKKDFPGFYDIAVGGHIDAGETPDTAVLREMREEIGLNLKREELEYLGYMRDDYSIGSFMDCEFAHVYLYRASTPEFHPGPEVTRMIWVTASEYQKKLANIPHHRMDAAGRSHRH